MRRKIDKTAKLSFIVLRNNNFRIEGVLGLGNVNMTISPFVKRAEYKFAQEQICGVNSLIKVNKKYTVKILKIKLKNVFLGRKEKPNIN